MTIQLQAKEVLMQLIRESQERLPFSLRVEHVMELLDVSDTTVYKKLRNGEIPGGKKIKSIGWVINRDIFLTWLYSKDIEEVSA